MANPQKENGYTVIANEIKEEYRTRLIFSYGSIEDEGSGLF